MTVKIVINTSGIGRGSLKNARDIEFIEVYCVDARDSIKSFRV